MLISKNKIWKIFTKKYYSEYNDIIKTFLPNQIYVTTLTELGYVILILSKMSEISSVLYFLLAEEYVCDNYILI